MQHDHEGHEMTHAAAPTDAKLARRFNCPMHPEVVQERPGMCPECGMSLVGIKKSKIKNQNGGFHSAHASRGDHEPRTTNHAGHSTNIFKTKFWVSLVLSVPVVLYSEIVQKLLRWQAPVFPGSRYLQLVLASVIFFYGGWVFIASAWRELRAKLPGMMTLISLAITTAYIYSLYVVVSGGTDNLFWELATLITIMLLGHWLEMRAVSGAHSALKELSKLLPDTAEVIRNGNKETVPLSEVREGDIVFVRPGGKIPTDGEVKEGDSFVNESLATGESKPVSKKAGSAVIAGTANGDGTLTIKVTNIGEHTFLAGVMRLVAEAQASKSRLQMLSDRAAYYLTIIAVTVGGTTLAAWLAAGAGTSFAIERLVAVLVIACPHALGLAVPLVASISTTKAANNGFLVKQRLALEAARNIDTVLFDKTGTLTKGEYGVTNVWNVAAKDEKEVVELAASVDASSEHPIAKAIVAHARAKNISSREVNDFVRIPGKGAQGKIDGALVVVGGAGIVENSGFSLPAEIQGEHKKGKTIIYVVRENKVAGVIALADIIREESREAVKTLKSMGVSVVMITGDAEDVAKWVAGELGIEEYFARVLPDQKSEKVKLLQGKGRKVAMVGDGINDAPALTQADLGIAIGAGTNVAIESAGIILVRNDPRDIPKIVKLSRMTYTKMIQNLWWAAGYNIIAIPLAAGVLAFKGILLEPALAAVLMSASTVIVAANAMLLRKKRL
ncbi:MAG: heavy metal translocating P-type ATPase [Candidatus Liptonbacteria bacterium]|nr:heavy metal translocating P-type ATPase [Candidatus Liptonbacteria bacterium]